MTSLCANTELSYNELVQRTLLPGQPLLFERVRILKNGKVNSNGRFIMYVMLNTLRGHENPALEVAIQLSNSLNLPLLVYTVLNDRWEHATE